MGEIFKPVGQWIAGNVGWSVLLGLFILSLFFEFSKIKLSPITAVCKWIGDRITSGLRADMADLKQSTDRQIAEMKAITDSKLTEIREFVSVSLGEIKERTAANEAESERRENDIELRLDNLSASRIKAHVLAFGRQCRNHEKHTQEDFKNLIAENAEYERLVKKYEWQNDVYKEDFAFIMEIYRKCIRDNDFLR